MTADEFKAWRQRHRMTQAQAAALFGASEDTVGGWERGRFGQDPKVSIICQAWDLMRPEQRKKLFAWCGRQK